MEKYYTPTIEEFYPGFEYEDQVMSYCGSSVEWKKTIFTTSDSVIDLFKGSPNDWYELPRVKYLDKEDIESLGFVEYIHGYGTDFRNKTHKIAWWFDNKGIEIRQITTSGIGEKCIFSGTIKNKSELKKLLKQLNIL